jgi:pimeloyl-ACP methyl ester carboxylesterase
MPRLNLGEVELYYEVHGAGAPLLGVHGTPSSAVLWEDAAEELGRLAACVIYDRRGFLRSQGPGPPQILHLSDHVADAAALLRAVSSDPAVVVGRSTGGLVALGLAHHHPDRVRALVLLEPAVFSVDPTAAAWAARLRQRVLDAAAEDPGGVAEAVIRIALGDDVWDGLPPELRSMFASTGPAVLAEIRGRGLDLSEGPPALPDEVLAAIAVPTLLVSAQDSPDVLRRVNARLAELLPRTETALVPGGHLIDPAGPPVLDFVRRQLG